MSISAQFPHNIRIKVYQSFRHENEDRLVSPQAEADDDDQEAPVADDEPEDEVAPAAQ